MVSIGTVIIASKYFVFMSFIVQTSFRHSHISKTIVLLLITKCKKNKINGQLIFSIINQFKEQTFYLNVILKSFHTKI